MKRFRFSLLSLLVVVCLAGWLGWRSICFPKELPSPDGTMLLRAEVINGLVAISVHDVNGKVLYEERTQASDVHRWRVRWVNDARIILDSSDIGARGWSRNGDGSWRRDSPLQELSPDGKLVLYTYWEQGDHSLSVSLLECTGSEEEAFNVVWHSRTDIRVDNLNDCGTWDSPSKFTVRDGDKSYSWAFHEGTWRRIDP